MSTLIQTPDVHGLSRQPLAAGVGRLVPILANPRAGSGLGQRVVADLVSALRVRGLDPHLFWQREELSELVATTAPEEVRCVVAAGGDGTLLEVLNRAPGLPVTVLPLGNENLVARFAGIPRSGRRVAEIAAAGRPRRLDLARANGRLFALMAGAGFDAAVVHRVHRRRRGYVNHLSYATAILQTLSDYAYPSFEVFLDGTGECLRGCLAFVFNLPRYALDLPIAREALPDDGMLDLCLFERSGLANLARYLTAILTGSQARLPDCQRRRVRRVRLHAEGTVPLQTDGDPAGCLDATVEAVPGGMTLVMPAQG